MAVFGALGWVLRRRRHHPHHVGYSLLALLLALGSVDASPAFRQITELVKSQMRDGDPDFAVYYKEPAKRFLIRSSIWSISTASTERTYFDNDAFPNLTPELGALKNEGLDFSHTMQLPGTDYTIAGWWLPSAVFRCLRRLRAMRPRRFLASSAEYLPRRYSEKLRLPELFRAGR